MYLHRGDRHRESTESVPVVQVLALAADEVDALEDVHDVVDSPTFDAQFRRGTIEADLRHVVAAVELEEAARAEHNENTRQYHDATTDSSNSQRTHFSQSSPSDFSFRLYSRNGKYRTSSSAIFQSALSLSCSCCPSGSLDGSPVDCILSPIASPAAASPSGCCVVLGLCCLVGFLACAAPVASVDETLVVAPATPVASNLRGTLRTYRRFTLPTASARTFFACCSRVHPVSESPLRSTTLHRRRHSSYLVRCGRREEVHHRGSGFCAVGTRVVNRSLTQLLSHTQS